MMEVLTFFFAALVVTAAVLVALDVVGVVAQLVVLGAPVLGALGPPCGVEETTIIGADSSKDGGMLGGGGVVSRNSRKLDEVTKYI